ncbi:hypothetical protein Tco_1565103, partial [Tanacetum coccineum]
SSHEPTSEPITTASSPHPQETQIPQTTSFMPHDSPFLGGYTPGSVRGSMQLKELTNLCTKLVARVTSLETKLKKTKEVHDEEEELVSEDSSKQGMMEETGYAYVEEENARVEYDFDLTEQQVTQVEEQNSDEELAKKVQEEEQTKELEQQEQERANLEATLNLQKQKNQERKATDDIDWSKIVDQAQERQSGSIIRYHYFKRKPVTIAQARKNMMIYLKNMANYKMKYFKGMSYDHIRPIFEEEYRKIQTLFKKDSEVSKSEKKRVAEEALLHQEKSTEEPKELSEEDLKKMLEMVLVEDFRVEAPQTKYLIID